MQAVRQAPSPVWHSTYVNVFLIGGVVISAAKVIFICSMKMIYSRSRVAEDED